MADVDDRKQKRPTEILVEYFRGKSLSLGMQTKIDVRPSRFIEQAHFAIHLARDNQPSLDPVFSGMFSAGRASRSIAGWVDGDYFEKATFRDDKPITLSELGLDVELFKILGGLIPDGGSLMVSYSLFSKESKVHRDTKIGLDRGYPPVVTPLGFLLFAAGCGMGFKDWYFAEGGREGPEKLQGFKPLNEQFAIGKAEQMLRDLRIFLNSSKDQDPVALECRSRAEVVVRELERAYGAQ